MSAAACGLHFLSLVGLLGRAAAVGLEMAEGGGERLPFGSAGVKEIGVEGVACEPFDNLFKSDLVDQVPEEVDELLKKRGLVKEHADLTQSLLDCKRGTFNNWKSSAIYRTMYIGGHLDRFLAKNVSLYLTKEEAPGVLNKFKPPTIKMCFVDRTVEPTYTPPGIYTDGKDVSLGKHADKRRFLKGGAAQSWDGYPQVQADKSTMPVDLLVLLEAKSAMLEHMNMAALINVGERSGLAAALVVRDFQEKFRAKGLGVWFCQQEVLYPCGKKTCSDWHQWFEYVDLSEVGEDYVPKQEYSKKMLQMYDDCKRGETKDLAERVFETAGLESWANCSQVAGAVGREKGENPECKCKEKGQKVFCGPKQVEERKFSVKKVLATEGCEAKRAYCAWKSCRPPAAKGQP